VKKIPLTFIIILLSLIAHCQSDPPKGYSDFPIIITLQFHSFALPFHDLKSNFSNIGLGIGTEVGLNRKDNIVQQISALWYRNKTIGNGLFFYSQAAWRPEIATDYYSEIKGGVGYLYAFRPSSSYQQVDGEWQSVGRKGKGMLALPVGIGAGYTIRSSQNYFSPFISYQFLLVSGYNYSVPIVPETLLQTGVRIH